MNIQIKNIKFFIERMPHSKLKTGILFKKEFVEYTYDVNIIYAMRIFIWTIGLIVYRTNLT